MNRDSVEIKLKNGKNLNINIEENAKGVASLIVKFLHDHNLLKMEEIDTITATGTIAIKDSDKPISSLEQMKKNGAIGTSHRFKM